MQCNRKKMAEESTNEQWRSSKMSEKWPLDLVDEEVTRGFKEQFLQSSERDGIQRARAWDTYLKLLCARHYRTPLIPQELQELSINRLAS